MAKKDVYNVPPVMPDKARKRMTTEVAPLRQQRRKLTPKEWTFVTELVSGVSLLKVLMLFVMRLRDILRGCITMCDNKYYDKYEDEMNELIAQLENK